MLFAYAVTLLGNAATAEEAVQESFRIACMKPEALIRSDNPVGWMVNTMKHAVRNIKRTQLRRRIGDTLSLDDDEVCLAQPGRPDEYADVEFSDLMTDEEHRMSQSRISPRLWIYPRKPAKSASSAPKRESKKFYRKKIKNSVP